MIGGRKPHAVEYQRERRALIPVAWSREAAASSLGAIARLGVRRRKLAGNSDVIAPPSAIVRALFTDVLSDPAIRSAILLTLFEVVAAYALAIVAGLALGARDRLDRSWPAQPVPDRAAALRHSAGRAAAAVHARLRHRSRRRRSPSASATACFPILVNVVAGMRNVNPLYLKAARAMGARAHDIFRDVMFPHMVASFFTGLRLAMTMTLLGVILAELYVSTAGVGYFTKLFRRDVRSLAAVRAHRHARHHGDRVERVRAHDRAPIHAAGTAL